MKNMSSIKTLSAANPVPQDLAAKLGNNGIGVILGTMWLAFYDLKKEPNNYATMDEDSITVEWYAKIYDRWVSENRAALVTLKLIPYTQYPDDTLKKKIGKAPAIDFCFRAWNKNDGYFGAECKRLRTDQHLLVQEYIENGIKRFTSGKYGSRSTVSAMVGYVQFGEISDIVSLLIPLMNTTNLQENLIRELLERF